MVKVLEQRWTAVTNHLFKPQFEVTRILFIDFVCNQLRHVNCNECQLINIDWF